MEVELLKKMSDSKAGAGGKKKNGETGTSYCARQ